MLVTDVGMPTLVNELQYMKVLASMLVTDAVMPTLVNALQL